MDNFFLGKLGALFFLVVFDNAVNCDLGVEIIYSFKFQIEICQTIQMALLSNTSFEDTWMLSELM